MEIKKELMEKVLDDFFKGRYHWSPFTMKDGEWIEDEECSECTLGNFWVARHGEKAYIRGKISRNPWEMPSVSHELNGVAYIADYETLEFEPKDGGQYEIAVRIWGKSDETHWEYNEGKATIGEPTYCWSGYALRDGRLRGYHTGGH